MTQVTANGMRFHVQRLGDPEAPETVVFLHGLVMDNLSSYYYTLGPALAPYADVVLYDLRGHGRSDRPATGYTVDDGVADLVALLDELGLDRPVHLVGNSYGGVVALGAAIDHPERVASLLLIEAHFAVDGWGHHMAGSLALAAFGLDDADVSTWLDQQGGRKLNRLARNAEALIYDTSMLDDLQAVRPLTEDELRAITCPVLAFYGEETDLMDRAKDLERLVPDCELHVLAGCTHSVLMEATSTLEQHLLARVGAPARAVAGEAAP
jgi:pimeloyl-ACP methyl ester carboxylesterase